LQTFQFHNTSAYRKKRRLMVEKQRKKSIPTGGRERAHGTYEQKYVHKY
jgi:hypothetical protein